MRRFTHSSTITNAGSGPTSTAGNPIIVGAGKPALPSDARVGLELLDERRFASGVVHLHYRLV
jgi:hypothetical protein